MLSSQFEYKIFNHQQYLIKDVIIFIITTIIAHHIYWPLSSHLHNNNWFEKTQFYLKDILYNHSKTTLELFNCPFSFADYSIFLLPEKKVIINNSCAGTKQFYQLIVVFLIVRGPVKHKIWFIPLGLFILHITNIIRVIALCFILFTNSYVWYFFHDWIFRPTFYVVIWFLWWLWVYIFIKTNR